MNERVQLAAASSAEQERTRVLLRSARPPRRRASLTPWIRVWILVLALGSALGAWLPTSAGAETVDPDEDVYAFGDAAFHGSPAELDLRRPLVDMASTPSGGGYWLAASDGGVFSFGDASFHGSAGDIDLNEPIVGIAPTPSGGGYWLAGSDGGVFTYGNASFHGSAGGIDLNEPIVGIAATPSGGGYWLVASDGGVFTYGDAAFHGSAGDIDLNEPIVAMTPTASGDGYWLVASDGGIFTYGNARFHGSAGYLDLDRPIVDITATPTGGGYWQAAADGGVFTYGDAEFHGSSADDPGTKPVTAIEATPSARGYWLAGVHTRRCATAEYAVLFPATWHVNDGNDPAPPCAFFHPRPFDIDGPGSRYDLAIFVDLENVSFERATAPNESSETVSETDTTVDGHDAVRSEEVATGRGELPRGTFFFQYVIDLEDGRTLIATTYDVGDGDEDYRHHKVVLADMMNSLDIR